MPKTSKSSQKSKKKKDKKNLGGAPTKYKPEHCQALIDHCNSGGNITSFAHSINVHKDTLYEWRKVNTRFSDAFKKAKQANFVWWRKLLQAAALGKKLPGSAYSPNLGAIAFAMKNECGWSDNPNGTEDEIDEVLFE